MWLKLTEYCASRKAAKNLKNVQTDRQTKTKQNVISNIHIGSCWLEPRGGKLAKIPYIIGLRIHKNNLNVNVYWQFWHNGSGEEVKILRRILPAKFPRSYNTQGRADKLNTEWYSICQHSLVCYIESMISKNMHSMLKYKTRL